MIHQTSDDLEEYIGNKYALVIVAAKRARQLKEGYQPLVRDNMTHPLSTAMREIEEHKLTAIAPPEEEVAPAPRDVIASLIAGTDFDLDEEIDLEDSDAVDDLAALLVGADEEEEEEETETQSDLLTTEDETESDEEEEEEEEGSSDEVSLEEAAAEEEEDEEEEE